MVSENIAVIEELILGVDRYRWWGAEKVDIDIGGSVSGRLFFADQHQRDHFEANQYWDVIWAEIELRPVLHFRSPTASRWEKKEGDEVKFV